MSTKSQAGASASARIPNLADDPVIGTNELARQLNKHPLSIYRYLREDPEFPVPIRISANRLAWRQSVINAYIASKPLRQPRKIMGAN